MILLAHLNDAVRRKVAYIAVATALIGAGWVTTLRVSALFLLVFTLAAAIMLFGERGVGAAVGTLLLVTLNAVPGANLAPGTATIVRTQDLAAVMLIVFVVAARAVGRTTEANYPFRRRLWQSSAALVTWWVFTLFRTTQAAAVPLSRGALYGRDFLYFAVTVPLLADFVARRRSTIRPMLTVIVFGVLAASISQVALALGHSDFLHAVHPRHTTEVSGFTRVYSNAEVGIRAVFLISLGFALVTPRLRHRLTAVVVVFVSGAGWTLQLARMAYIAGAAAVATVSLLWWFLSARGRASTRRRLAAVPLIGSLGAALVWGLSPAATHVITAGASRATTALAELSASTGTVGYRLALFHELFALLHGHWLTGLGFLHPASHYVAGLPSGSIRNPDTGVLNGLMTMGVVGAVLLYIPVVIALLALVRAHQKAGVADPDEATRFGLAVWLVATIVASVSLGELFSQTGLQVTAFVIALTAAMTAQTSYQDRSRVRGDLGIGVGLSRDSRPSVLADA